MRRSDTIGVMLPDLHGEFFSEIIRGADLAARARGLHLLVSTSHGDAAEAAAALRSMRGRVDGLSTCQRKDLVTSHAAFGYLAQRFDLRQVAINGLSPEQEPDATEIARVSTYAKANGVTTVYAETLASPAIATTVAREIGAKVATLDPVEGLSKQSSGKDYFAIMRSNLTALQAGQGCS